MASGQLRRLSSSSASADKCTRASKLRQKEQKDSRGNRYDAQHKNVKQSAAHLARAGAVEQHPVRSLNTSWLHSSEQRQNESTQPDDASGGEKKRGNRNDGQQNVTQFGLHIDSASGQSRHPGDSLSTAGYTAQNKQINAARDASCEKGKGAAALPWPHLDISQILQSESQPEQCFGSS